MWPWDERDFSDEAPVPIGVHRIDEQTGIIKITGATVYLDTLGEVRAARTSTRADGEMGKPEEGASDS